MFSASSAAASSVSKGSALNNAAQTLFKSSTAVITLASGLKPDLSPAAEFQAQANQAQIDSTTQALANTQDAVNTVKTAQSGLGEIADRVRDIETTAVAAANGIGGPEVKATYQQQVQSDLQAIRNIVSGTQFNGKNLLDGSAGAAGTPLTFQTGPGAGQTASIALESAQPADLGADAVPGQSLATVDLSTPQSATQALQIAAAAGQQVANQSAQVGAFQASTLEPTAASLTQSLSALSDTNSHLQDTDYGTTAIALSQDQLTARSSLAIIAQAGHLQTSAAGLI